jgi:hypothetical protein
MQNKTLAIGLLSLTAIVLAIANSFLSEPVMAAEVIKDRDYSLVTAPTSGGGDALYVLDSRTGQVAVLTYDANGQTVRPRKVRALMDAFAPATR